MSEKLERLVVIDGNSLVNRAYYAIQRPMITKEGLYTHGVYGFLNILSKIKKDYEPDYLAVAFDLKAPTFRHKEYEEYKAGRRKMPMELSMQIPILKEVLDAMNITRFEMEGFEADDIIGTLAKRGEAEGHETIIITGDKDELQLATERTKVLITRKGISEFDLYDEQAMIDHYGFTPTQFIDFKGLRGDPSDNIPGIPGVGEKTAQKLILEYGSVENVIKHVDEMPKNKLRDKIEEYAMQAMMSKRLATIFTEVPVEADFEDMRVTEPDYDRLVDIYSRLEFNSLLKKLRQEGAAMSAGGGSPASDDASQEESAPAGEKEDEGYVDPSDMIGEMMTEGTYFIKVISDHDHVKKPVITGAALMKAYPSQGDGEGSSVIKTEDVRYYSFLNEESLAEFTKAWNDDVKKIAGHDIKDDMYSLIANGFESREACYDTAIAQYLIEPSRRSYDLSELCFELMKKTLPNEKEAVGGVQLDMFGGGNEDTAYADFAKEWLKAEADLAEIQVRKLAENRLFKVLNEVELPLIEVLASMEYEGIRVDRDRLISFGEMLLNEIKKLEGEIYELAGEEFNINSPKQLGVILFEKMGLPAGKKTKTGYSTSADILEKLAPDYPIVSKVLEFRGHSKLRSTYVEGMLPLIDGEGKIHAHFQQTVTATGRLSCTEPNLQNIPVRTDLGRELRGVFIPDEGKLLAGADYSQIELRVLADMSGEESLIEAFNRGDDIHRLTASRVFGVEPEMVTPLMRSNAKVVNFGVIYGMSGFGLSSELSITRKEAETYIKDYFNSHPKVREFMDAQVETCRETGYVTTLMGRRRYVNEINASNFMTRQLGERLAMNTPIQGTAADIIKLAMIRVFKELREKAPSARLLLQIHDELIITAPEEEAENVKIILEETMKNAVQLKVTLEAESHTGKSWLELK